MSISIPELISLAKDKTPAKHYSSVVAYEADLKHQLENIIDDFTAFDYLESLAAFDIDFSKVAAANADNLLTLEEALATAIYKKVRWSNEFSDTLKFFTPTYQITVAVCASSEGVARSQLASLNLKVIS